MYCLNTEKILWSPSTKLTIKLMTGNTCSRKDNGKVSESATVAENFCVFDVIFRSFPTSLCGYNRGLKYSSIVRLYGLHESGLTIPSLATG